MTRVSLSVAGTALGNGVERLLTFAAVALTFRSLEAHEAGGFALMLRVAALTGIFVTLGIQAGAVRLVSEALSTGRTAHANLLLKSFFKIRALSALALVIVGSVLASVLARTVLKEPSSTPFVRLAFISAATNGLLAFSLHHLQARQRFLGYVLLNNVTSLLKIFAIVALIVFGVMTPLVASGAWAFVPLVGVLAGLRLTGVDFMRIRDPDAESQARKELLSFSRWLIVAGIATALFVNLDSMLIARYLGLREVALYGAAINLSLGIGILSGALVIVLLPTISQLQDREEIRRFFMRAIAIGGVGALLASPLVLVASQLVRLIYGPAYIGSVTAFRLLFIGALVAVIYNTAGLVFFSLNKPKLVAAQSICQVATSVVAYLILIPRYGIVGGAAGTLVGHAAALLFVLVVGSRITSLRPSNATIP